MTETLTVDILLQAYANGLFPMADQRESDEIYWYDPDLRGQLDINSFKMPRRLKKTVRQNIYRVSFDTAFEHVIKKCAEETPERSETWINQKILNLFLEAFEGGFAHSVEVWDQAGQLVGGLYGLSIGAAFFGESMFSRQTDASKVALVHLVAKLWHQNFDLLDTQFVNEHLKQFGVYELPKAEYKQKLLTAVQKNVQFSKDDSIATSGAASDVKASSDLSVVEAFLQSITQTS